MSHGINERSSDALAGQSLDAVCWTPTLGLAGPVPIELVLSFVDGRDILSAIPASRSFSHGARSDMVWQLQCEMLWQDKVFVPERFRTQGMSRLAAYWGSISDASRTALTREELCSCVWHTRMKGWSGPDWTAGDPWWNGGKAGQRHFHLDGTTSSADRGSGQWRFVPDSCGRRGAEGSFVRLSRGGRDFPTHFVSRWSKNWGWILQNCWGFSASFPLPPKGAEPELEDDGEICQLVTVDVCRDEAMRFNMGLPLPHEDVGDVEDGEAVTLVINGVEQRMPAPLAVALSAALARLTRRQSAEDDAPEEPDESSVDL